MNDPLSIPVSGPIDVELNPPGSKSLTNRALICAALADGVSRIDRLLDSEDTRMMLGCLQQLGVAVKVDWAEATAIVTGSGGSFAKVKKDLSVGNSGTTIRFLLPALAACGSGRYRLVGTERMSKRPIRDLTDAINELGGDATPETGGQNPPVTLNATGLRGGTLTISGLRSSQFVSGLMMAAPYMATSLDMEIADELVSKPFVTMTQDVMRDFGVEAAFEFPQVQVDSDQSFRGVEFTVEPDATAASYFFAAAAITGGTATVPGLGTHSIQGDLQFVELLRQMGCEVFKNAERTSVSGRATRGIECNMAAISDTVMTLAAVAAFAESPTTIRGVAHNRWKESDRISDLARELQRVGCKVDEVDDGLVIHPRPLRAALIETYDDHRMAMSMSLLGLSVPGIEIKNPGCVSKTYPRFFADLLESLQPADEQ